MGTLEQRGEGEGYGATINIPLPAGTGDRGYLEAMERVVDPAARHFRPELIIVSAGQDASMFDPLGRMLVTMAGFRVLGQRVRALADELCGGRLLVVQEGGYSEAYTPFCTLGALEGITGISTPVPDPYVASSELARARDVYTRDTAAALDNAVTAHRDRLAR
jgi:acetoin utilization deacetylase AcuC-like enzyme